MPPPIALQDPPDQPPGAQPGEYFTTMQNEHRPDVALRDLADQLGLTMSALHQHARAGKIPTHRVRNVVFVTDAIARQVREWHKTHRNYTWPVFTEDEESDDAG